MNQFSVARVAPRTSHLRPCLAIVVVAALACGPANGPGTSGGAGDQRTVGPNGQRIRTPTLGVSTREAKRLPTGRSIQPAGNVATVGPMPLTMVVTPERTQLIVSVSGYREQGLQLIDRGTGEVRHMWRLPSTFYGLTFSADGRSFFASGGNQDVVYMFDWFHGDGRLKDSVVLATKDPQKSGTRYPAGIGVSADGKTMYVAENLADSLAVIDIATKKVVKRFATERYPLAVVVALDGTVYVSAWGGNTISVFKPNRGSSGDLNDGGRITVARHPSGLALNGDGSRLFVASGSTDRVDVIDTETRRVMATLLDPPPGGPSEGSTPNSVALSIEGTRLFVAEADNNAIAVFNLSAKTANILAAKGDDKLAGRMPTAWYPTHVMSDGDAILVLNGKGMGAVANPKGAQPDGDRKLRPMDYALGQLNGALQSIPGARASALLLGRYTDQVSKLNNWGAPRDTLNAFAYPPFEHVVYVIKENRTYDQVFGDIGLGDGDPSLTFFGESVSPNHRALAKRFGLFDRFFVNAEVSADGHNWSTAAYATDYVQKTVQSQYAGKGRHYDYEGTNRGFSVDKIPADDVNEPANGYLWNLVEKKGISFRNYGEFVSREGGDGSEEGEDKGAPGKYVGNKPFLQRTTNPDYPGFNMNIRDQKRMDIYLAELAQYTRDGKMPALEVVRLPNDHTFGVEVGKATPRASFADNDLALGRLIEGLSKSPFWKSTVVFVLEDDAQDGPDHVDSHRSPMLVISPYAKAGVVHRFANTTDVIATMVEILKLGNLSQFDYYGAPLRDIWTTAPDLTPYVALTPQQSLDDKNAPKAPVPTGAARQSKLDFSHEDRIDDDRFNRVLWKALKGDAPYPGPTRMSSLEWTRAR
ncbi:MAG: bifunctional YncE family protein/alkaline phosphatase family protein [Gemmatimonadaceae bacterium]